MAGADIFIAGASDRTSSLQRILGEIDTSIFSGGEIALKANYNSADPPPASTHIDTLDGLCTTAILAEKPKKLTLPERSGMGNTPYRAGGEGRDFTCKETRVFRGGPRRS